MSIFDTLKAELLEARKNKNVVRADTIRSVTAELEKKMKDEQLAAIDDATTVKELKKQIDNQKLIIEKSGDKPENAHYVTRAKLELGILEPFVPQQLTEEQIVDIIKAIPGNDNFKNVIGFFNANHAGLFAGGTVRQIWTNLTTK